MLRKICNILSTTILLILFCLSAALFAPRFMGYDIFAVISGSMEPNIHVGSVIYAKEALFEELKVGDVISFSMDENTRVTHRITAIDEENQSFTTKGDANDVEDGAPVLYKNVIGKVALTIPMLGYISVYVRTPIGIACAVGIVMVLLLLNYLPDAFGKDEDEKKKVK